MREDKDGIFGFGLLRPRVKRKADEEMTEEIDSWKKVTYITFNNVTGETKIYVEGKLVAEKTLGGVLSTHPTQASSEKREILIRFMFQNAYAYIENNTLMAEERKVS